MQKVFKIICLCMVLIIVISSCSSEESNKSSGTALESTEGDGSKVIDSVDAVALNDKYGIQGNIEYSKWGDAVTYEPLYDDIKAFNQIYPHINVKLTTSDWSRYWETLKTEAGSGIAPDVFKMSAIDYIPYFASIDALEDMSEMGRNDDDFDISMYNKAAIELCSYDGKVRALPLNMDVTVMAYNVDMFKAAGINPPDENWTWNDLLEAAKLLTLDENGCSSLSPDFNKDKVIQWGINNLSDYVQCYVDPMCYSEGGSIFTEDGKSNILNDKTQKAFKFNHDLIWKHRVSPSFDIVGGSWFQNDLFAQGKCAMSVFPSYWLHIYSGEENEFNVNFEVFQLPMGDSGKRYNSVQSTGLCISSSSANTDAAWAFTKYMAGKEMAAKYTERERMLSAIDDINETVYMKTVPLKNKSKQILLDAFNNPCPVPKINGFGDAMFVVSHDYLQMAIMREPQYDMDRIKKLDEEVNRILEEAGTD